VLLAWKITFILRKKKFSHIFSLSFSSFSNNKFSLLQLLKFIAQKCRKFIDVFARYTYYYSHSHSAAKGEEENI
jgi:hypothetical protein